MYLRKPETCPFANGLGREERIEYLGDDIGRDTDAGVLDFDRYVVAVSDSVIDVDIVCSNGD